MFVRQNECQYINTVTNMESIKCGLQKKIIKNYRLWEKINIKRYFSACQLEVC